MRTLTTGSFAGGFQRTNLDTSCSLEEMCKSSVSKFWECLEKLIKIGQADKADELFDKYVHRWIRE